MFRDRVTELTLVGTEAFTAPWQHRWLTLSEEAREAWLDLVEEAGKTLEGLCQSDHLLFVGQRSLLPGGDVAGAEATARTPGGTA